MSDPPVAGVDDKVARGPCLVIDEISGDMPDLAVGGCDVVTVDRIATAQKRIIVAMADLEKRGPHAPARAKPWASQRTDSAGRCPHRQTTHHSYMVVHSCKRLKWPGAPCSVRSPIGSSG